MSKSKDWLARNQNNVSEWSDMSTHGLLFQWDSTIKIQLSVLIQYKADVITIISLNESCSRHDVQKNCSLAIQQQLLTQVCYWTITTWTQFCLITCVCFTIPNLFVFIFYSKKSYFFNMVWYNWIVMDFSALHWFPLYDYSNQSLRINCTC
jgi:hypothetical protein